LYALNTGSARMKPIFLAKTGFFLEIEEKLGFWKKTYKFLGSWSSRSPISSYSREKNWKPYISKENHWSIGNQTFSVYSLGLGWIWRTFIFVEALAFWIFTRELGAQRDEKDKCYVQLIMTSSQTTKEEFPPSRNVECFSSHWEQVQTEIESFHSICFTYIAAKIEITIVCSKQIWELLTAVHISKGNHWTIKKSNVLCVFLGFGLDLENKC